MAAQAEAPAPRMLDQPSIADGCNLGEVSFEEIDMLSARNQIDAVVKSVKLCNVMAEVVMDMNGVEIISAITRGSAEHLGLKELARWYVESVHAQGNDDVEFLRFAAHVYELNSQFERAIHCWERIRKLSLLPLARAPQTRITFDYGKVTPLQSSGARGL